MKKQLATLAVILIALPALAQNKIKELTIGDQCPDLSFSQIVNAKPGTKLSQYRNKHLIICFVSPACGLSHTMFPKLQQLQKQYAGDLQILLSTTVTAEQWKKIKSYNKEAHDLSLQMVLQDTVMENLFPHVFKPHTVWMDETRKVVAITDWEYMTTANLDRFIKNEKLSLPLKKDIGKYNSNTPLLSLYNGSSFVPSGYSILTPNISGMSLALSYIQDTLHGTTRFTVINAPLLTLYKITLTGHPAVRYSSRYVFDVRDKDKWMFDSTRFIKYGWELDNTYCYEAVLPLNAGRDQFYKKLRTDLESYLGYTFKEEQRKTECLVLKKKDSIHLLESSERQRFRSISSLVEFLNLTQPLPVIDESGITGPINLPDVEGNVYDPSVIENYLSKHGLQLLTAQRKVNMFVIQDK